MTDVKADDWVRVPSDTPQWDAGPEDGSCEPPPDLCISKKPQGLGLVDFPKTPVGQGIQRIQPGAPCKAVRTCPPAVVFIEKICRPLQPLPPPPPPSKSVFLAEFRQMMVQNSKEHKAFLTDVEMTVKKGIKKAEEANTQTSKDLKDLKRDFYSLKWLLLLVICLNLYYKC